MFLVVDDDPAICDALAVLLSARRVPYRTAASGQEALDVVADEPPMLMLIDLQRPELDGSEVIRELRARGVHVPAVLMGGNVGALVSASRELGLTSYLAKPFTLRTVLDLVDRLAVQPT
jgi:CheY-like chemotaxis protein